MTSPSPDRAASTEPRPRLSIVIATWQAAGTLERCLRSIIEQEFQDWELLIADGASTDGTTELIGVHRERIAWWQSKPDNGIYDAWNQALGHGRGEYVCFLGADDRWADQRSLSRIFSAIGDREFDLVTSSGLFFDSERGKSLTFGSAWNYDRLGRRTVVCHPGLLHRRSLFERHGRFDTQYKIAGDLDFLLRIPRDVRTLHVDMTSVVVEAAGVSRRNVLQRLKEQREVLANCERYGAVRAYLVWLDKLWRLPIARVLGLSH